MHDDQTRAAIIRVFSRLPEVIAVYPMTDSTLKPDGTLRLAVIADAILPYTRQADCIHELELELDTVVDVFPFDTGLCPPVERGSVLYSRDGNFESDNGFYLVYNEDDPVNASKVERIEQFADAMDADHRALDIVRNAISDDAYDDDMTLAYKQDWRVYLTEYPTDLLVRFLKSKCSHLKTICPSSPILACYGRWRQYA